MTTIIITGVERADVGAVDNVELLGEEDSLIPYFLTTMPYA